MSKGKTLESFNSAYKHYKKQSENPVALKDFVNLNNMFSLFIRDCILNGEQITLPQNLGTIQVAGRELKIQVGENGEMKGLTVDWGKTKRLWKECEECKSKNQKIYLFNEHSDSVRYRIYWLRANMKMFNKQYYTFVPARNVKELLRDKIVNGKEYLILEGNKTPKIQK